MANSLRQIVEPPSQFFQELAQLIPWLSKLWRTLGQVEKWHEVGTSGEPAFAGTWANTGGAYNTLAFYKDPWNRVHIKGHISSGTLNTATFTLPIGYRPSATIELGTIANTAFARLEISSVGVVLPVSGSNVRFGINCSFRAEQ